MQLIQITTISRMPPAVKAADAALAGRVAGDVSVPNGHTGFVRQEGIVQLNSETDTEIRAATGTDAESLTRIYNFYVRETIVTFEERELRPATMAGRVDTVREAGLPWLVAEHEGAIAGYAYATAWKSRSAYRFSVEVTVFTDPDLRGRGIGSRLYARLLPALKVSGMHSAIGSIALPNEASESLHRKFGFERTGLLREVGFKFNRWIDVACWQILL